MTDSIEPKNNKTSQKLQVWCCDNCRAVHFKAGNVLLDFTRSEFKDLARAVTEIYQQEFGDLELYRLLNSTNEDDDILLSQTVA